MKWIYFGLKESMLIQSFLLFWSIYGIYVAVMKNENYNKRIIYSILPKNNYIKIMFWYMGNQRVFFSKFLNYIIQVKDPIERIEVKSNCELDDFLLKNNKIAIIKKEIVKNDLVEIELYGKGQNIDVEIIMEDTTSFEFTRNEKKPFLMFIFIFALLILFFLTAVTPLISSFVDKKWEKYYLLEEEIKQYDVALSYTFKDEYNSIYDKFSDIDTRNYEIAVAIANKYNKVIPLSVFIHIEEEILKTRIKNLLECISVIIILAFWVIKYQRTLPPTTSGLMREKYSVKLQGDSIYFRKYIRKN